MSRKNILVIGALSEDEINLTKRVESGGGTTELLSRHKQLGGKGGITAISTYRASHGKPVSGTIGTSEFDEDRIDVHLIAGVADDDTLRQFRTKLQANGILDLGVRILPSLDGTDVTQDYLSSTMESETGKTHSLVHFGTSDHWPIDHFKDIRNICGEMIPDLVIITMELKTRIVEQIIETFDSAKVDTLLLASPGEPLSFESYERITHLVCNESDAARMLGEKSEDVNKETWPKICDTYIQRGVKNVVLKAGARGAYFKNEEGEDFATGYNEDEIVDITGATNAFVGTYAAQFVKDKDNWNLKAATERGNKAFALFAGEIGYDSIPWTDDIDTGDFQKIIEKKKRKKKIASLGGYETKDT